MSKTNLASMSIPVNSPAPPDLTPRPSLPADAADRAALILDLAGEAIIAIDDRDVILSWNRAAETLFGYTAAEVIGRSVALLVPAERLAAGEVEMLRQRVCEGHVVHGFETERLTKDRTLVKVSITLSRLIDGEGRAIGHCCVIRDVSLQRVVVHRLYESEKLAALRAIAVGLAHEIGNPLAGVLGLLQLVERRTGEPETRRRLIEARGELVRLGQIIRELTDFTRADGEAARIDVNEVLRAALTFAKYAHEAAPVTVTLVVDPQVRPMIGSRNHMLQACLHLIMNAYDAMNERGGALTVRSRQCENEIVLEFEDTGRGMPSDVVPRIFEPFFTTKPEGCGTGLGLFVCRQILSREFGGRIDASSHPGAGSRFTVTLPLS